MEYIQMPEAYYEDNLNLKKTFKKATSFVKKKVDQAGNTKVGKLAKKAAKTAVNVVKNVAGVTVLLPLQPLRPMMTKELKARGVTVTSKTSLADVAYRFYENVVRKQKKNYDSFENWYEMTEDHQAVALTVIVPAILEFIKSVKAKKDSGQKLTKAEETIANGTEIVQAKIEEKAKETAATEVGKKILFDKKTWMIIGGVLLAIIIITIVIVKKK